MSAESIADKNIAVWKVKKLIKSLEMARGCVSISKFTPDCCVNVKKWDEYDFVDYSAKGSDSTGTEVVG